MIASYKLIHHSRVVYTTTEAEKEIKTGFVLKY